MTPLLYEAYVGVKRAELDAVGGPGPQRGVPALCRDLLSLRRAVSRDQRTPNSWSGCSPASSASCRARSSCAIGCTRDPELAHARGADGRGGRAGAAGARARRSPGPAGSRVSGRADGGARWRCARSSTACRSKSARAPRFSATGGAMHACGHDVHMAALRRADARGARARRGAAGAACWRSSSRARRPIPPARSSSRATSSATLAPAAIVAAHVHPELPWGTVALDPGAVNASCDAVEITVEGEPSHGAYPHHGRDPILAIAQIVVALHAQVARRIDPLQPGGADRRRARGRERRERDPRAGARAGRPARAPPRGPPRAARAGRGGRERGRGGARLSRQRRADTGRAGARERPRHRRARARAARDARASSAPPSGARAARTTSRSSARWRRSRWASWASTEREGFKLRPLHHPELLPPDSAVGAVARAQAVLYVAAASSVIAP